MVHIISPQPRLASSAALNTPLQPLPSSSYIPDDPFYYDASEALLMSPPRLMSPIHLPPDCGPRRSYLSRPATPCSPTKRRRAHPSILSRSRARRHCPERTVVSIPSPEVPPVLTPCPGSPVCNPPPLILPHWDVADLSLLDVEHPSHSLLGPVGSAHASSSRAFRPIRGPFPRRSTRLPTR
ncbi:hypothetical protein A0H81_04257 [Grifola frondosa]|uniref:Uncharacterized protein n=1 Tax=Grifola frondosa TaxID=5627 RepID=A0A1C7MGD9_GRIFR|nr:hypothetical protein A0H81_04257 [Grifola frondosa]